MANSHETSNFSGIWNRGNNSDQIKKIADELSQEQLPLGVVSFKNKKKTWGITDALLNFAAFLLVQIAMVIIGIAIVGGNPDAILALTTNPIFLILSSVSMYAVWIGGMWYVTKFKGKNSFKLDFKVWFKKFDVFIGLGIAAALYGLVFLSQKVLTDMGVDLTGSDNGAVITGMQGIWFILMGIGIASILGPISEELFFRGFLLNSVIKTVDNQTEKIKEQKLDKDEAPFLVGMNKFFQKIKVPLAIILSSAIFGLMHFQGVETFGQWYVVIVTGTLGLVFGIASIFFKRIGPGIFAHIFYNGGTLLLSFFLS